ncbi:MAG: carboxypeptidase regulatory-like domain-containing protein [Bryobacteraceae bacterium]
MKTLNVLLLVLALLAFAGISAAQTETGQVTGKVLDPSGAVVPNAKVSLKSLTTNLVRDTVSNEDGIYLFPSVLPGDFELTVEVPGFARSSQNVVVTVGARVGVDVRLEVGRPETVIQVTETAGLVNVETQTLSTVITRQSLADLPTLTRNPYELVVTAGNISGGDPSGRGVGYAINGQRSSSTNILLDGSANNDEFTATPGQYVPLDSVQEFSLLKSNFTAEYGRATGGVVNVATRSGTSEFHGSLYEYNRVSRLGANSFDNNANRLPKSVYTRNQFGFSLGGPIFIPEEFNKDKDKLFFFTNVEWFRIRSAARRTVWIPADGLINASAANTKNFFSTYGKVRSSFADLGTFTKAELRAAGFDPCKGGAAGGGCALLPDSTPILRRISYDFPADSGGGDPRNEYQWVTRLDYNVSSKTQMYGRLALQNQDGLPGSNSDSPYQGFDTGYTTKNQNWLFSVIRSFSPQFASQSKVVFNRLNQTQPLGDFPPTPTLYAYGTSPASILGSYVGFPGYLPFSPGSAIPFGGPQNFVQLYQDMSYIRGRHQLRFGGAYTYIRDNRTFGAYQNSVLQLAPSGQFGQAIDNLLAGKALTYQGAIDPQGKYPCGATVDASCTVTLPVGQPSFSRSNRYHEFAYYIQDSWKVHRNLTLNAGLRWEYFGVQHHKNPKLDSNFYLGSGNTYEERLRNGQVMLAPDSPVGGLWGKDYNNYGPRAGFAWDMFGNGKTSLRGGYGLFYERNFGNVTFNVIQNPPNYAVIAIQAGIDVPEIPITTAVTGPLSGSTGSKALPRVSLRAVDQNIRTAYAHIWSLSLERALTSNLIGAMEYSGSAGRKLYSLENPNTIGSGNYYLGDPCDPTQFNCTSRIIMYRYTSINLRGQLGSSDYNGINFRLTAKRIRSLGITGAEINYTWSHALDNLSDTFSSSYNQANLGIMDRHNPDTERGNAYFDVRHRVVMSGTWDLPLAGSTRGFVRQLLDGWSFNPILVLRTGYPYSLYDCTNAIGYPNGFCPMAMFDKPITRVLGDSKGPALSTPNLIKYYDYMEFQPNHDWYNPKVGWSDFGPYPPNMVGRNVFRGPGAWNLDLGLNKNFRIGDRYRIQFRFETYNTLNHSNLYADTSWNDSNYEYVPAYREDNRNVQMALRFEF